MWKKQVKAQRYHQSYRHPLYNSYVWIKKPFPEGTCLVIGHRGSSISYPENTLLAFREAISEEAGGVECDIYKTSDGQYVIIHDTTVDRTTDGTGTVSNLTLDYIKTLDAGSWKGAEFANREDTKVPTLDEFLEEFRGLPIFLMLQVKLGLTDVKAILDIVESKKMLNQCFIFTSTSLLQEVKQYKPKAFVMNDGTSHQASSLLPTAIEQSWDAISTNSNNYTVEDIALAKENKILIQHSFIASDFAAKTQSLIDLGFNFILGDDCASMMSVANANGVDQIKPIQIRSFSNETWEITN